MDHSEMENHPDEMFIAPINPQADPENEQNHSNLNLGDGNGQSSNQCVERDVYHQLVPVRPLGGAFKTPYYPNERQQVTDGLAVLEILYSHQVDAPEFIDINDLVTNGTKTKVQSRSALEESNDDVIFVGEYKANANRENQVQNHKKEGTRGPAPRRNPVRQVRKNTPDVTKELLYGDYSDEEYLVENDPIVKRPAKTSSSPKDYKTWPVDGLHERPEYNATTNKVEKFDYTIREIKNSIPPKRQTIKMATKAPRKRKYFTRRNKNMPQNEEEDEKVPLSELKELTELTFHDLREFIENVKVANELRLGLKNKMEWSSCNPVNKDDDADIDKPSTDPMVVDESEEHLIKNSANAEEQTEETDEVVVNDTTDETEIDPCDITNYLSILKTQGTLFQVVHNLDSKKVRDYFSKMNK